MANEDTSLSALARDTIESLAAWRDDLKVRIHLASMEARDAWKEVEPHLELAEAKLRTLLDDAKPNESSTEHQRGDARTTMEEVRAAFDRVEPKLESIGDDLSRAGRELIARLRHDFGSRPTA